MNGEGREGGREKAASNVSQKERERESEGGGVERERERGKE